MSDPKTRRRIKKRAVSTPKSSQLPIAIVTTGDSLVFRAKPVSVSPFTSHPLPEGRKIQIGYRVRYRNGDLGPTGTFDYPQSEDHKVPISRDDLVRVEHTTVWAEPYAHAAVVYADSDSENRGMGRLGFGRPRLPLDPVRMVTNLRVMESVVGFIVGEMNRNVDDGVITKCHKLNVAAVALEEGARYLLPPASTAAYAAAAEMRLTALGLFYAVERTGGIWDHKVSIAPIWGQINRLGDSSDTYFYDIWSNIHFGYVGHAAAFSMRTLYIGSGIQNFLDHFRGDENEDQGSAKEGFDLYRPGRQVTIEDVLRIVARHPEWRWAERNPKKDDDGG